MMKIKSALMTNTKTHLATILLVDDSAVNLGVVVEGLESHGYEILVALDGEEALHRAELVMPDLILLDVMMPGIDGFEVCRQLKAQELTRDIPVIFMTSLSGIQDKLIGFDVGGVDYITKPMQVEEAKARIDTHLELRVLRQRLEIKNRKLRNEIDERNKAEEELREKVEKISEMNVHLERQTDELRASREVLEFTEAWYRGIIRSAPDGMMVVDEYGCISLINHTLERMFGYTEAELLRQPVEMLLPFDVRAGHVARRNAFIANGKMDRPMEVVADGLRASRKDGSEFPVDVSLSRLHSANGRGGEICVVIRDITLRKQAEQILEETSNRLEGVLKTIPDLVWLKDGNGVYLSCNHAFERFFGVSESEIVGKLDYDFINVELADFFRQKDSEAVVAGGISINEEWVPFADDGRMVLLETRKVPMYEKDGRLIGVLGVGRDITARRQMEDALAMRELESRTLVENSPDIISRYDRDCRRVFVNRAFGVMVEGGISALLGKTPSEFPGGGNAAMYEAKINEVFITGEDAEFELKWKDKNSNEICSHVCLTAERDASDVIATVLAVGRDITELNAYRHKIHQMAFYDTLTSLPNRALFNDRLRQMLTDASWHQSQAGLMMLDLDRFKVVNDSLGHPVGDLLLSEAAVRLLSCVRSYDTVARLGGDEFAILLPEIRSGEDLGRIASKIIETFAQPFLLEGHELFVSASIGITLYPDDSLDADDLIKHADSAMYFAKRSGRNDFRFYSSDLSVSANERLMLESDLRRGFGRGELSLHFQPKVNLINGALIGSEALLRWHHPQRGMVPPDKFIGIAEDSGLIVEIGAWVLGDACRVACLWNGVGKPLHKVAVNLSARQFQSDDILKTVRNALQKTGCLPEWLELEITESLLLEEDGKLLETLESFREMGLTIAIDDFGTGYSSLGYLARYPIDTLKIDRSFINRISEAGQHMELVKAILSIAKCMNQQVVAEGVETAEQALLLQSYGCQIAQGYFFGKPMSQQVFEEYAGGC